MLMKKMSSYQKLKAENQRLKNDIYLLVMDADGFQGMGVAARYRLQYDMDKMVWFGERKTINKKL